MMTKRNEKSRSPWGFATVAHFPDCGHAHIRTARSTSDVGIETGLVGHAVDDTMGRRWKKFVTFESPRDENRLPSKDGRLWDRSGDE